MNRGAMALGLILAAWTSGACIDDGEEEVRWLRVQVWTGGNGTDGDVSLCWVPPDGSADVCEGLSSSSNDFESGSRQRFDVKVKDPWPITARPSAIWIRYRTGLSIGDQWDITKITVTAFGNKDFSEVYCRIGPRVSVPSRLDCPLEDGDAGVPSGQ